MELSAALPVLQTNPWFAALPAAVRGALVRDGRARTVEDGATLYRAGDANEGLYAVLAGEIRLTGHSEAGRRIVYLIAQPGDWIGEMSVLDGKPRLHDAIARGPARILHLGAAAVDAIAVAQPGFDRALGALTCLHQRTALAYVERALTSSSEARLAFVLLDLAHRHGRRTERGVEIDLRLSQEDLAAMIGLTRQSLAPLLNRFRRQGAIATRYARIALLDPDRLRAVSGG